MDLKILRRPRRNRRSGNIRRLVRETVLGTGDLVWPVFVHAGVDNQDIASMPGVVRYSVDSLVRACAEAQELGIPAVGIFPAIEPSLKDPFGTHGLSSDNLLYRAICEIKRECPELVIMADVALDPYTDHGHDGVLSEDGDSVENDETVEALCRLAVMEADSGADFVAPSDMMDGRIQAIREALDLNGHKETGIIAYSAKYASALYGPFRDAVGSVQGKKPITKVGYQMDPGNVREALTEVRLDEIEGADIVMIKPASYYLDVIRAVRGFCELPVSAYQVSGEYAQIHAAARLGWLDYEQTRDESLLAIKRAGADMIWTYFAVEVAKKISGK